jgi:hypothetical protein
MDINNVKELETMSMWMTNLDFYAEHRKSITAKLLVHLRQDIPLRLMMLLLCWGKKSTAQPSHWMKTINCL